MVRRHKQEKEMLLLTLAQGQKNNIGAPPAVSSKIKFRIVWIHCSSTGNFLVFSPFPEIGQNSEAQSEKAPCSFIQGSIT